MSNAYKNDTPVSLSELYSCRPANIWRYIKTQEIGFWLVCLYLFFEYVRPQSIYEWIDFFPWTAFFLVSAFFYTFVKRTTNKQGNAVNKLVAIYGIIIILSSVFAVWPELAFDNLSKYWNWVLAYFVIVRFINTRERFFIFLLLYLLCTFKMSQHGFLSWTFRGFSFADWGVTGGPGWFHNSGEFGIQLAIFVPLSTAFVLALRGRWGKFFKIFFYAMPITGVGSVVATSSRGAFLALVVTALWSLRHSKYFLRTLLGLVVFSGILILVTPEEFKVRFDTAGDDKTSTHRLDRWEAGWDATLARPLLGYGHKNWEKYFRTYLDDGQKGSAMIHNIFLQSLTEHGFIGLGCFLLLIINMFRMNKKVRVIAQQRNMAFERMISFGLDAGLIGLIVSASFITVLYYPYVWIHAALVSCLYNTVLAEPLSDK